MYFLFRALETGRRLYFTIAGAALAAGLYTYLGFRFVPVEIAVFLAYIAVAQRRLIARNLPGLALYAVSFAVVVLPLGQYAVLHPDDVLARTRDINVFDEIHREGTLAPLTDNVVATLKMMNVRGDANGRHNLPNAPMLDEVSAALLVLGLAVCVWSFRNWRRGAMAVWLVLALVPGALTISAENPSGIRAVGAIPPVFLVIGLSVQFLQSVLARSRPGAVAFGVGALLLVATSGALNYHQFFGRQVHSRDVYNAFIPSYTDVAKVAVREADRGDVFLTAPFASSPIVQALTHGKNMNAIEPDALSYVPRGDRDAVVIADTGNFALAAAMQIAYPHLQRQDAVDPYGRTYFTVLTIPMAERNAPPPPPGLFTPEP